MSIGLLALLLPVWRMACAQEFQIVWVVVGEAEATAGNRPARAGRHLFMASELMSLSMKNVKVARIDVAPAVSQMGTGQRLCVSALHIVAYGADGAALDSAPLSISVRQDQKQKLAMSRDKTDICVSPSESGEYPLRFSSLLPAPDGTTRGAQIFLRVGAAASTQEHTSATSQSTGVVTRISNSSNAALVAPHHYSNTAIRR